jgi:hypothetical protein
VQLQREPLDLQSVLEQSVEAVPLIDARRSAARSERRVAAGEADRASTQVSSTC